MRSPHKVSSHTYTREQAFSEPYRMLGSCHSTVSMRFEEDHWLNGSLPTLRNPSASTRFLEENAVPS